MDTDAPVHVPDGEGELPQQEKGKELSSELAPNASPSLSPASSDHAHTQQTEHPNKRKTPTRSTVPPPKRTAAANAEASSSRLLADEPPTDPPGRRRPARASAAKTYVEESSSEQEQDSDQDEGEHPSHDSLPFDGDDSYTPVKPKASSHVPTGRKRGRPPGAKNKNPRPLKEGQVRRVPRAKREPSLDPDGNPKPRKMRKPGSGRPKGSKNRSTLLKEAAEARRKAEEENGGPLPEDGSNNYDLASGPPQPDIKADQEDGPDLEAIQLAHEALLRGLPADALDLHHHQYEQHLPAMGQAGVDADVGQTFHDLLQQDEQFQQAEAIQVALQQQMLLRQQQEQAGQLQ